MKFCSFHNFEHLAEDYLPFKLQNHLLVITHFYTAELLHLSQYSDRLQTKWHMLRYR